MARHARSRRGRNRGHREGHEGAAGMERWLLTYADMLTLLFALFILLYAMSSPNSGKFNDLKKSLQEAFSGKVLPGGSSILERGASERTENGNPQALVPADIAGTTAQAAQELAERMARQDASYERLKKLIDAEAARDGLSARIETSIERRGLVVRLLTDKIAFDSGSAALKPQVQPLLKGVSGILAQRASKDDIVVEGYTDSVPVRRLAAYPTNWELSSTRATAVLRYLIRTGMRPGHLSARGFAYLHPIASNKTVDGRSRNRRVEIVVVRPGMEALS